MKERIRKEFVPLAVVISRAQPEISSKIKATIAENGGKVLYWYFKTLFIEPQSFQEKYTNIEIETICPVTGL